MAVLSKEDLEARLEDGEILDDDSVETEIENHVESASVMLTVDRNRNIISNTLYADDIDSSDVDDDEDSLTLVQHPIRSTSDRFKIPSRELAILTTREKVKMPQDLVGRVGIRLSASKYGLIPLFGPQVDPGFEGQFYAIIYNASDQDFELDKGEFNLNGTEGGILKLEVQELTNRVSEEHLEVGEDNEDDELLLEFDGVDTQTPDLSGLRDDLEDDIDELKGDLNQNQAAVTEVKNGYSQIVLFGVFLLATATFGAVLSPVTNAAAGTTWNWSPQSMVVYGFMVAWLLTAVAITGATLFNVMGSDE